MNIEWNKVTWYSKLLSVILIFAIFALGLWLGYELGLERGQDYKKYLILTYRRHTPQELAQLNAIGSLQSQLIGSWRSSANPKQIVTYSADSTATVRVGTNPEAQFNWSIEIKDDGAYIKESGMPDRYYKIAKLDADNLEIIYQYNQKSLSYTKVK